MTAHPCCQTPGSKLKTWSIWVRGGLLVNQGPSITGRIWFATVIDIPPCLVRVCQFISLPGQPRQGLHRAGARMKAETSMLGLFAATMDRDSFERRVSCPGSESPSHLTDLFFPTARSSCLQASSNHGITADAAKTCQAGDCQARQLSLHLDVRPERANGEEPCLMHSPIADRGPLSIKLPMLVMGQDGAVIAGPKTWVHASMARQAIAPKHHQTCLD